MDIKFELVPEDQRKPKPNDPLNLDFGSAFTDHMFSMKYSDDCWHSPLVGPYKPFSFDPATLCLHYGQGIFEGMKAYRRRDRVFLFRPEKNFERLNASANRMVMPQISVDFVLDSLKQLLRVESDWIPQVPGTSLYMRPTMIATEVRLGLRSSHEYIFFIILSPVGLYFKDFVPVGILVSDKYARSASGGVGFAKTMGNYAASLLPGKEAAELGFSQVMYLDSHERKFIEEAGTMNIFILFDDELVTPPLTDTILPGITRDSLIQLARDSGTTVNERSVSIDEVVEGIKSGKVLEVFGAGTAAIVAPIGTLFYKGESFTVADGEIGIITQRLFDELIGIQCGEKEDRHGWVVEIS